MTSGFDASVAPPNAPEPAAPGAGWQQHMAVLADLGDRPLTEHVETYQSLHAELQAALADIDGA